jgi:hypothetical protein
MMLLGMQPETVRPLVCAECGRHDPGDEPGWTLRLELGPPGQHRLLKPVRELLENFQRERRRVP